MNLARDLLWISLVAFIRPPSEVASYRHCPTGWTEYIGSCYFVNKQPMTWQDADKYCSALAPGAKLAVFLYNGDNVGNAIPMLDPRPLNQGPFPNVWIGISYDLSRSTWIIRGDWVLPWMTPASIANCNTPTTTSCGYFYPVNGGYFCYNCNATFPSYCSFTIRSNDRTASTYQARIKLQMPLNRLYGGRDISEEQAMGKPVAYTLASGSVNNVALTTGPSGMPGGAVRFLPSLPGSGIFLTNANSVSNVAFTGISTVALMFNILPIYGQPGTVFSYLWNTGDGKGLNVAYDGNISLIVDARQISGQNAVGGVVFKAPVLKPGVWQTIALFKDYQWNCYYGSPGVNFWYSQPSVDNSLLATTQGLVLGHDPATGFSWNGSLCNFAILNQNGVGFGAGAFYVFQLGLNSSLLESYVDDEIIRRLPKPLQIPSEERLIGFWPLTDYYDGKEGSGKVYSYPRRLTDSNYVTNSWLKRKVFTGNGLHSGPIIVGQRDYASLALYQSSFAIVLHIQKSSLSQTLSSDTIGPLIEFPGNSGAPVPGLSIWMLSNGTLVVASPPSSVNGVSAMAASFPNCYPTNPSSSLTGSTYRLTILYDYSAGTLTAMAGSNNCSNTLSIGQRNFDTFKGFQISQSVLTSPFQDSNITSAIKSFVSGHIFCLFVYDTDIVMANITNQNIVTTICNVTSSMTPMYSGPNNLLYKAANLRAFWPLGRDLGATDISGRNHNGDLYRIYSSTGPTGLPYSASQFFGSTNAKKPFYMTFSRPEYTWTFGTNNSVTYAFWIHIKSDPKLSLAGYTGAIFVHAAFESLPGNPICQTTGCSTGLFITSENTIMLRVMMQQHNIWTGNSATPIWTISVTSPTNFVNRWMWVVVQYNRLDNTLYLNVDGITNMLIVANVPVQTSSWISLGAGNLWGDGDKRIVGKMSCFMMYDYAVRLDEFATLKSMCSSTLSFYYGKYSGLFSYPNQLALFLPLTQSYLGYDISGHNIHTQLNYNSETKQTVFFTTGPTNIPGTAAKLGGYSPGNAIMRDGSYNNQANNKYNLDGVYFWGYLCSGKTTNGVTLAFYFYWVNDANNPIDLFANTNHYTYLFAKGSNMYFQLMNSDYAIIIPQMSFSIPSSYLAPAWIFFTLVLQPMPATNAIKMTAYFDGAVGFSSVYNVTAGTSCYPCFGLGFILGRVTVAAYTEANSSISCVMIINEVIINPLALKSDCNRILSGQYDSLIAGNLKPTASFPLAAQTEGDNTMDAPHGYFRDADFTTGPSGVPNSALRFYGIDSQYFIADSSYFPFMDVQTRTLSWTFLYNIYHDPAYKGTATKPSTIFGFLDYQGLTVNYQTYPNNVHEYIVYHNYIDAVFPVTVGPCYSYRLPVLPGSWHTLGYHQDAIGDNMFNTIDGSLTGPILGQQDAVTYLLSSGSFTIGFNPTLPLSWTSNKYPLVGMINCFQMHDRGLNLAERKQAMKWCANPDYMGCFAISTTSLAIASGTSDRKGMTANKCRNICGKTGQRFAAIERGYLCRCLDTLTPGNLQPIQSVCPQPMTSNNIEEGGSLAGDYLSVYNSALTRRIGRFSVLTIIPINCPPGWSSIPPYYQFCYLNALSTSTNYVPALAYCTDPNNGFQSSVIYPEDDTEDQLYSNFLSSTSVTGWIGCSGGTFTNPTCTRYDNQRNIGYFQANKDAGAYAPFTVAIGKYYSQWHLEYYTVSFGIVCKAPAPQLDVCPRNSTRFFNSCFMFVKKPMIFDDAETYCQSFGPAGHLATITSFAQQRLILNITDYQSPFWIGMKFSSPGNWSWIGFNNQSTYSFWPGDFSPNAVDMAAPCVFADSRSVYQWRTASCYRLHNFLCEFQPNTAARKLNSSVGGVPDFAITSSAPNSQPFQAKAGTTTNCWCGRNANVGSEYIQIDYAGQVLLKSIRVAGCVTSSAWVSAYSLLYSNNGLTWANYNWTSAAYDNFLTNVYNQPLTVASASAIVLPLLTQATSSFRHYLQTPIAARFFRIVPLNFTSNMCLQYAFEADLVDSTIPDIRANTFWPLYIDTYREAGMGVTYKLFVYRLGFSPFPQLYSGPQVIRTTDFTYAPRLIGSQKLLLVATDAEGQETELPIYLQLETRTRSFVFSTCPTSLPSGSLINCFTRLVGGSNVTISTVYGLPSQGQRKYNTTYIAPRNEIGLISAKPNSTGNVVLMTGNSTLNNRVFLASNFPFKAFTTVHAIEADMTVGGLITVSFWQSVCPSNTTVFCLQSYSCISLTTVCSQQHFFNSYKCPTNYGKCQNGTGCCSRTVVPTWLPANNNFFPGPTPPVTYQFINQLSISFPGVGVQIYYIPSSLIQEYPPGTIMGYTFTTASYNTGQIKTLQTNITTFSFSKSIFNASQTFVVSPVQTMSHDFAPMMRAITLDSSVFGMNIRWAGACGTIPFTASAVDAAWPDNVFTLSTNISMASPCGQPILAPPNTIYAQTPISIQLLRTFDCFCSYQIGWSDMPGPLQNLSWTAGALSTTLAHTFPDAGTYTLYIRAWNYMNDSTYSYTVNVTLAIGSIDLQIANQPALPLGQPESVSLIAYSAATSPFSTSDLKLSFGDSNSSIAVNISDSVLGGAPCQTGWSLLPTGVCLLPVISPATFGDAEFYCSSVGATLAFASSSLVVSWTNISAIAKSGGATNSIWTGVTRLRNANGFWVSVNNELGPIDSVWQLTNSPTGADCAALSLPSNALTAQQCSTLLPFVCQQPSYYYKLCGSNGELWVPFGTSCYKAFPSWSFDFQTASQQCRLLGGALASPKDSATLTAMTAIANSSITQPGSFYLGMWRGNSHMAADYHSNVYPLPSLVIAGSSSCVSINSTSGQLIDTACMTLLPALCERPSVVAARAPSRYFNRLANRRLIRDQPKIETCASGWNLYGGLCYSAQTTSMAMQAASTSCFTKGGTLAVISSPSTNLFIQSLLGLDAWIGLATGGVGNRWLWLDGSGIPSYNNWAASATPIAAPTISGAVMSASTGTWTIADSSQNFSSVCVRKPSNYGYGRKFSGNCPTGNFLKSNGTCVSQPSISSLLTFQQAAATCLNNFGGTLIAPSSPQEWQLAMSTLFAMQWNGPSVAVWTGFSISSGAIAMPNGLSGNPPSNKTPFYSWVPGYSADLSQPNCLALYPEGGLQTVSCSSNLAFACQTPAAVCPNGWTIWGGMCYKSSEITAATTGLGTPDVATQFCQLLGAYPVSLATSAEWNIVRQMVKTASPVAIGQTFNSGSGTLNDAAGRNVYNANQPPPASTTGRAYVSATNQSLYISSAAVPTAMQTICQRPSSLTPDDCALNCMTSLDPVCATFEYHGDYCIIFSDFVTKYSYGLRNANGGSDLYSISNGTFNQRCTSSLLASLGDVQLIGNDLTSSPSDVILGRNLKGFVPATVNSTLEIIFSSVTSIHGFRMGTASVAQVTSVRFDCATGITDGYLNCFPHASPFALSWLSLNKTAVVTFPEMLAVRRLRVVPLTWTSAPSYQLELLGCSAILGIQWEGPHAYASVGNFTSQLQYAGAVISSATTTIQQPVSGLTLGIPVALHSGSPAIMPLSYMLGTETTINATYGNATVQVVNFNQTAKSALMSIPHELIGSGNSDGLTPVTVSLDNAVSDPLVLVEYVYVEIAVTGIEVTTNQTDAYGTLRNEPVQFFVTASSCSRCLLTAIFHTPNNGISNFSHYFDFFRGGSIFSDIFFAWNLTGLYQVDFYMANNVSNTSTWVTVAVENPARNFIFTASQMNRIPINTNGQVSMQFSYSGPAVDYPKFPTNPLYRVTLWDGTVLDGSFSVTTVPASGMFHTNLTSLSHLWNKHGTYSISYVISNNVTIYNDTGTVYVTFEEVLTGLNVTNVNSIFVTTGLTANVSFRISWGVPWQYCFVTNISDPCTTWVDAGNTTQFQVTTKPLNIPGYYTPAVYGRNDVSSVGPVTIDIPIKACTPLFDYTYALSAEPRFGELLDRGYEYFSTDEINVTVWYNTTEPYPSDVSAVLYYGDGGGELKLDPFDCEYNLREITSGPLKACRILNYVYTSSGVFTIEFDAKNSISQQQYSMIMPVFYKVPTNVFIQLNYRLNSSFPWSSAFIINDIDQQKNKYFVVPSDVDVQLTTNVPKGAIFQLCWAFGDGTNSYCPTDFAPTPLSTVHTYTRDSACGDRPEDCDLTVNMTLSSPFQSTTAETQFFVQHKSINPALVAYGPIVKDNYLRIDLTFNRLATDACVLFDFGSDDVIGPRQVLRGSEYMCSRYYRLGLLRTLLAISPDEMQSGRVTIEANYTRRGKFYVKADIRNTVEHINWETNPSDLQRRVLVTGGPCISPIANAVGPSSVLRSQRLDIVATAQMNCSSSTTMTQNWTMEYANGTVWTNVTAKYILKSLSNNVFSENRFAPVLHDLSLSFPKKTLPVGVYRFTFQVDMPDEDDLNLVFQFIVQVNRTALVASFNPASVYVDGVFGFGYVQKIEASTLSYDPDQEPNGPVTQLQITYYCKRACEGSWPAFDSYDKVTAFVANPRLVWKPKICPAITADLVKIGYNKSGCFYDGWHSTNDSVFPVADKDMAPSVNLDRLMRSVTAQDSNKAWQVYNLTGYYREASTGGVIFKTAYMFENETFNMLAIVVDPNTARFALAVQAVRLEKGEPPSGVIKPLANCGASKPFGCLTNPTARTTFRRTIDNFIPGRLYEYNWHFAPAGFISTSTVPGFLDVVASSFYESGGVEELETMRNWTNLTSTGRDGPDISFNANAFTLPQYGAAFVLVSEALLVGSTRVGRTMSVMYIDKPPNATGASCVVNPSEGTAMSTRFSINCKGFDPQLRKFTFVAYSCPTCDPTYITPIPQPAANLQAFTLPTGNPSKNFTVIIRVYCYDTVDAIDYIDVYGTRVTGASNLDVIQQQYNKLAPSATKYSSDFLVMQLIGFVSLVNSYEVQPPYRGNATLLNDPNSDALKRSADAALVNKDFDRYNTEMKTISNIRLSTLQWINSVGVSTSSVQSIKSYCSLLSLIQAVPAQVVSLTIQKLILTCVKPTLLLLTNYSADITVDPNDLDAASSSCVSALGNLAQVIQFTANYTPPSNPMLTTTTIEPPLNVDGSVAAVTTTVSPQIIQLRSELDDLESQLMVIVLKRKGVQESPSVVGGTSSKIALSSNFVGNMKNAQVASGGPEDCGRFQLGDPMATFGPSVIPSLVKMGVSANDAKMFSAVKIDIKASMSAGNVYSSVQTSKTDMNSMVHKLEMVDEEGNEVIVKNLKQYIEVLIESRNPTSPVSLITSALGISDARTMKPINLPVARDSAVFITVEQIFNISETELATNASCNITADKHCKDPYANVTLRVGNRNMTVAELNATKEEVAIFVFINSVGLFPKDAIDDVNLGCILPRHRIEEELLSIASSSSASPTVAPTIGTTTQKSILISSTAGPTISTVKLTSTKHTNVTTTALPTSTGNSDEETVIGPAKKDCKKNSVLPSNTCFFRNDVINVTNSSIMLYVGVRAIPMSLLRPLLQQLYSKYKGAVNESDIINAALKQLLNNSVTALIRYSSYTATCIFWDETKSQWSTTGCYVGPLTTAGGNPSLTQCFCNHLTAFGSNFDVPMNTFDPNDSAFTHLDSNPVCFTFGICIFCLYFCLLIWARKKDREDEIRWGSLPLADNNPRDKYAYEITIWTGQRQDSGTSANVQFILVGDEGETHPRLLDDVERPILSRGQVDSFLMTVRRSLGKLQQLRIWHDNSGKHPAWYFSRMMVHDLQRNQQFFFLCNQWLAVEEDDGQVERAVPVADKTQLAAFEHQFVTRSQRKLTDGHLWISVFSRPPRSAFTRTQRLTCCLSVLYCTMLSNIMFFGKTQDPPGDIQFKLGPISMTSTKILMSLISALITMPVNLVIVQMFRMSKRRLTKSEKKMEAIIEAASKTRQAELQKQMNKSEGVQSSSSSETSLATISHVSADKQEPGKQTKKLSSKHVSKKADKDKKKKKTFKLPWWCCIVAYCLAAASCGVAFWAIVETGGALGPDRATQWVIAMVISLVTDIILLQPIKIVVLAMFFALIIKNPTKDEDIEEHMMLKDDEQYLRPLERSDYEKVMIEKHRAEAKAHQQEYVLLPPDPEALRQAREIRLKELAMWAVIKEIAAHVIFLYMIMFVAYNNVDVWSRQYQKAAQIMFFDGCISDIMAPPFNTTTDSSEGTGAVWDVSAVDSFWFYAEHTLLPTLFDSSWYNGAADTARGTFTKDKAVYLAGILRLRQLRIGPNSCHVAKPFRKAVTVCNADYTILNQESRNFSEGWQFIATASSSISATTTLSSVLLNSTSTTTQPAVSTTTAASTSGPGWTFYSTLKTGTSPAQGELTMYDGSGYVVDMPKSLDAAQEVLAHLKANKWLDEKTRALFLEFNLFSPARSLFAVSQTIFEFPATGGLVLHPYFYVLKLNSYSTAGEVLTLAIQIVTLGVVVIVFVRECNKARKQCRTYFRDFWRVVDFCHLLSCMVWAAMFGIRYMAFSAIAGKFRQRASTYTNLDIIVLYDSFVSGFAAAIVAVGTLRFIRLLRFNRQVMLMLTTLQLIQKFLLSFAVTFAVTFLAFAQLGCLAFGAQIKAYSTFITSLETLMAMLLGVFDYTTLRSQFSAMGPTFFTFYSTLVVIVLMNFFIAFVVAAYEQAASDESFLQEEQAVVDFMFDKFKKVLGLAERRTPSLNIDKRFLYLEEAFHEDEIERFTAQMELLMAKLDEHIERTKAQFPSMFDTKTLQRTTRQVYITE